MSLNVLMNIVLIEDKVCIREPDGIEWGMV